MTDATLEPVTNESLFARGRAVIPGGVNSPVRAFRSVGGTPKFIARGEGAHVWDVEGNRFIDYVQSYGASILGHAHPRVIEAVRHAAGYGTTFGAPTEGEVVLAEMICDRVPGVEQVRLVSSGTEATMSAIRLARAVTGRSTLVKFDGNYHGHSDALLAAAGSGLAEQGLAASDGVTAGAIADTVVVPYNVVPDLDDTVAVVIVEPVAANTGLIEPDDGFLAGLRAECDRVGALLLFDEVITGFRLEHGGATAWSGVRPDLWCFGKVIGGGLPVGAFASSAAIMANLAPLGRVYQAGTLSGNPLATAAGRAVLAELDVDAYQELTTIATSLADGLRAAFAGAGVPVVIPQVGPLVGLFFGDRRPRDHDEARALVDRQRYPAFFHGMLDRGVALAPGAYEVLFPSLAHSADDIRITVEVAAEVASSMPKD
jgi:glutamate-1-semialdehyde 2,1-aminomutase